MQLISPLDYEQLGAMQDLDEAIILVWDALVLCPQVHPTQSQNLDTLARYLCFRLTRSKQLHEDNPLAGEVILLVPAMQFLGFRSAVGTMWVVDDAETNKIASTFYKYMVDKSGQLDHTHAALALNRTMKSVDILFDQRIIFVRLGASC